MESQFEIFAVYIEILKIWYSETPICLDDTCSLQVDDIHWICKSMLAPKGTERVILMSGDLLKQYWNDILFYFVFTKLN